MLRGNVSLNDWKENCGDGAFYYGDPTPGRYTTAQTGISCTGGVVAERTTGSGNKGNVYINSKWSFNLTGVYQLPLDFSIGASLTGRQGYPLPYQIQASNLADVSVDPLIILQPMGETRLPNIYELDLRAAKDFRFFSRVGLTLTADLFNAPNQRSILQRSVDMSSGTGARIVEVQSPRVWRFGARFNF
jgi:hypothetical protein